MYAGVVLLWQNIDALVTYPATHGVYVLYEALTNKSNGCFLSYAEDGKILSVPLPA